VVREIKKASSALAGGGEAAEADGLAVSDGVGFGQWVRQPVGVRRRARPEIFAKKKCAKAVPNERVSSAQLIRDERGRGGRAREPGPVRQLSAR